MGLTICLEFAGRTPLNYGEGVSSARTGRHRRTVSLTFASLPLLLFGMASANGQQANQPGFDPRQTERRFDALESGQRQPARPGLRMPQLSRPAVAADTRPQFNLRGIVLSGAVAIPRADLIRAYQPYLGKRVSQADLVAIADAISDLYRTAGFHLSRAIVPPQDVSDGRVRIQVIEGSITEVALRGDGAEQFGIRPMLGPVLAERPSRLATLERQLLLINGRPGPSHRRGKDLAHLQFARHRQSGFVIGWPLADLCGRGLQFLSSARRHASAQSVDHAWRSQRACVRPVVL